jgi:HK97 family phage portal protein
MERGGDPERAWFEPVVGGGMALVLSQTWGTPDHERIMPTFQSYSTSAYSGNAVVFGVILARLQLFSEATFKWQNLRDKSLFGDPSLALLEEPWPNGTTGELLARMEQDASLAGNAFIRNAGDRLERLRPDWITIVTAVVDSDDGRHQIRKVVGYSYDSGGAENDREPDFFMPDEIAHWNPVPDPIANYRGMSWLSPVVREINADIGLTAYKTTFLDNAATPNLLIRYDRELSEEAARKVAAAVQARHGGQGNAFKTMVLDKGAQVDAIGADFTKMDFTNVQAAGENRIAVAGGVPGIVVGLAEGLQAATYSNYEQAMRRFADITMRPNWRSACGALQKLVTPPHPGVRLWFDTSDIAALRQGEMERAQTFQVKAATANSLIQAGFDPLTVAAAIEAGDLTQAKHTGRIPVSLYNTDDPVDPAYGPKAKITEPVVDAPPVKALPPGTTKAPPPKEPPA